MRPFKNKLSPSLDVLLATLVVGVPYTPRRLGLMFEGGAPAVLALLERAMAMGAVRCSGNVRGYATRYWLSSTYKSGRTSRPLQPADMHGELQGYDLMARARLCGGFRRQ